MATPISKVEAPRVSEAPLAVHESRAFRAYHDFLRSARNHMEGPLYAGMRSAYARALDERTGPAPTNWREAEDLLDGTTEFQLYSWYFRNLQRFKYSRPGFGIFATLDAERERLEGELDRTAQESGLGSLRLDPNLELPDYFRYVPFHQHTGGVANDALDGMAYELGRRTTVPSHADPDGIYHLVFDRLPKDRSYARVLDWGAGHGAGLVVWKMLHPESDAHGVDLSAPCLKLALRRARERGVAVTLSQQDLEHLDYADDTFDLVFFNFMLHEIPPARTPALLREACRVLKPGGLFAGGEFHLRPGDPVQNAIQRAHAWLNNETYAAPWYETPIGELAADAGFSRVSIEPFERLNRSVTKAGATTPALNHWNFYVFEK